MVVDFLRKGAVVTWVAVELGWVGLLWVLWVGMYSRFFSVNWRLDGVALLGKPNADLSKLLCLMLTIPLLFAAAAGNSTSNIIFAAECSLLPGKCLSLDFFSSTVILVHWFR